MQEVIALVVSNLQLNLAFDCDHEVIFDYLHRVITNNELCILKDPVGKIKALFRGSKIDGAFITKIDPTTHTILTLQIENLRLQNNQLKTIAAGDSWKSPDLD